MTRFNTYAASQSHQMFASAHTVEASCRCTSAMNNTVISILGAAMLASIFVAAGLISRLSVNIIVSIIILSILITLYLFIPLKEPPYHS